jgi:hypothetical protein
MKIACIIKNWEIKIQLNSEANGIKRYLGIEHDDNELLEYFRKQAGLHRE